MIASTTGHSTPRYKKTLLSAASIVFWLAVWQLAAIIIGEGILIVSPLSVLKTLLELLAGTEFYGIVGFSFLRISIGIVLAMLIGISLALLAYKLPAAEILLRPLMGAIKAAPVASFVVIALLAVGSKNLSSLISFLMLMPVFYTGLLTGMKSVEPERFEAAAVFGMLNRDRFRFIYLPYVAPHFSSACEVGIGIAWKAGVSAEVIGIAAGSIGGTLYDAKLNLEMETLFAYTLVVIIISLLLEKLAVMLIRAIERRLER